LQNYGLEAFPKQLLLFPTSEKRPNPYKMKDQWAKAGDYSTEHSGQD
jgi:hypothetical protein